MNAKQLLQGKWLGHPLHPALVHVPTALWPAALVFDLLSRLGDGDAAIVHASFACIFVGLLAVIVAVPAGVADWMEVKKDKPAWDLGLLHMVLNGFAAAVWALNLGLRWGDGIDARSVTAAQLTLSVVGTAVLAVSGYLGGRMVFDQGIGVARSSKQKWRTAAEAANNAVPEEKNKSGGEGGGDGD